MVIGAGQMGAGIAQVCAQAGYDVLLNDIEEASYDKGIAVITKNLARNVDKERMTAEEKQQHLPVFQSHFIYKTQKKLI